jgi:DNA mismatch repair ATPase MutS
LDALVLSIRYLSKMIHTAHTLAQPGIPGLEEVSQGLEKCWAAAKAIPRATASLVPERGGAAELADLFQEYLAILFLMEVRKFYAVIDEIRACRGLLVAMFEALGELDALQAIASFREGLGQCAKPDFQTDGLMLEMTDVVHPLLASPVPNSISLGGGGCLITGSNMSGKSTFLRTLGVNVVLAQSVFTCPAAAYKGSLFRVITSLSQSDDLIEGKSFYIVEAERLLTMLRSSKDSTPTLCIIDEVLCGTNSRERLAASEEILEYLAHSNAIVITATHDIELVDRLAGSHASYHFSDYVDDQGLHFDYLMRPGKATTTNAIRLLEYLGYPREIVDKARTKAFGS